jgi:hypothetical protein
MLESFPFEINFLTSTKIVPDELQQISLIGQ